MRPGSRGNISSGGFNGFRRGDNTPGGRPNAPGGGANAPGGRRDAGDLTRGPGGRGGQTPGRGPGERGGQFSRGSDGRDGGSSYFRGDNRPRDGRGNYYGGRDNDRDGYGRDGYGRGGYDRGRYDRDGYRGGRYDHGGKYGRGGGWYGYGRYGHGGYYYNNYNRWLFGFWGLPWYLGNNWYGYSGGYGYPYNYAYYDWGYPSYSNPYYVVVDNSVIDYSQPLAQPTEDSASDVGLQYFDAAREAFKLGDYNRAMELVDSALRTMPLDSVLHEFRALILFAQGKYQEAAAVLHPVLSAGPGWNWATLLGLYPNVDVYTQQLRALEKYRNEHKQSAVARFLLGYHYLTCGHEKEAADEFRKVAQLEPGDQLSRQLLKQLTGEDVPSTPDTTTPLSSEDPPPEQFVKPKVVPPQQPESATPSFPPPGEEKAPETPADSQPPAETTPDDGTPTDPPSEAQPLNAPGDPAPAETPPANPGDAAAEESPPEQPAAEPPAEPAPQEEQPRPDVPKANTPAERSKFVGTWKAAGENNMTFVLTLKADGTFNWVYTADGETHKFDGQYTVGNGLMTLVRAEHGALVGKLKWVDDKTFNFKMVGGGADDAGLTFKK